MRRRSQILPFSLGELAFILLFAIIILFIWNARNAARTENELRLAIKGKSDQRPRCKEGGRVAPFLFTATVHGPNKFMIEHKFLTIKNIKNIYRHKLEEAKKLDCTHRIKVTHIPSVNLDEYLKALSRLEGPFYIKRI